MNQHETQKPDGWAKFCGGVKHWHKWTLHWERNERGYMVGSAMICEECRARKRTRYVGSYVYSEYARPDQEFESIKTGAGRNGPMLNARAIGRRYHAMALLAWRRYECSRPNGPSVAHFAKELGWDLPYHVLIEAKPGLIEPAEDDQTYFWHPKDLPADPGPY
jgi:hypothetical protein